MNTTVSKSFGLALLLAVGIIAVMVAMGAFTSQRAAAEITAATTTIVADPDTPGKQTKITIELTDSEALENTSTITVTFPVGTTLGNATKVDITGTGTNGGPATATNNNVAYTKDSTVSLISIGTIKDDGTSEPTNFKASEKITVVIAIGTTGKPGITLPLTSGKASINTSTGGTAVEADLVVGAVGTLDVNPTGAGAVATVTVKFYAASLLAVGDTISIELEDFGVPSSIAATSVLIRGESGSATADGVSVSVDTIIITIPEISVGAEVKTLGVGTEVTVLIRQSAGITLPTAAAVAKYRAVITTTDPATAATNTKNTNAIEIKRELSLSPTSGAKGTEVTASGKGWGSTGPVMLWIDDGTGSSGTANDGLRNGLEVILANSVAVSGGAFSATFTADTGFGKRETMVQARDAAGNYIKVDDKRTFTVKGSLSLDKDSVRINEELKITLSEYGVGSVTGVKIGGVTQDLTNNATSALTLDSGKATFTIEVDPDTPLGTQVVSVTAGDETTTATIAVVAVPMTVSPTTAALGQEVTVSATGFNALSKITDVTVGAEQVTKDSNNIGVAETGSDANGNLTISFNVPTGSGTGESLILITAGGRVGEARITIPSPTLSLSASESRRNSRITATGTGFVANDSILLTYKISDTLTRAPATATTDSVGAWSVQFVVPVDAVIGGTHTVTADATTGGTKQTAEHKVPGAEITLDPATAASGDTIKISGSSFPGYAAVGTVTIGDFKLAVTGQTNAEGFFSTSFTVPQRPPGTHNVSVDIGGENISAQLVIPLDTTQTVEDVFADLIANESLQTIWRYDFDTRTWTSYTTDPETSFANDLFEVESSDILNINVSSAQTFSHQKGSSLFEGWNLITLN